MADDDDDAKSPSTTATARAVFPLRRPRLTQQQQGQLSHLQALADQGDIRIPSPAAKDGSSTATTAAPSVQQQAQKQQSRKNNATTRQALLQQIDMVTRIRQGLERYQAQIAAGVNDTSPRQGQIAARHALYAARHDVLTLHAISQQQAAAAVAAPEGNNNNNATTSLLPPFDAYARHFGVSKNTSTTSSWLLLEQHQRPPTKIQKKQTEAQRNDDTPPPPRRQPPPPPPQQQLDNDRRQQELARIVLGLKPRAPVSSATKVAAAKEVPSFVDHAAAAAPSSEDELDPTAAAVAPFKKTTSNDDTSTTMEMETTNEPTTAADTRRTTTLMDVEDPVDTKDPIAEHELATQKQDEEMPSSSSSARQTSSSLASPLTKKNKEEEAVLENGQEVDDEDMEDAAAAAAAVVPAKPKGATAESPMDDGGNDKDSVKESEEKDQKSKILVESDHQSDLRHDSGTREKQHANDFEKSANEAKSTLPTVEKNDETTTSSMAPEAARLLKLSRDGKDMISKQTVSDKQQMPQQSQLANQDEETPSVESPNIDSKIQVVGESSPLLEKEASEKVAGCKAPSEDLDKATRNTLALEERTSNGRNINEDITLTHGSKEAPETVAKEDTLTAASTTTRVGNKSPSPDTLIDDMMDEPVVVADNIVESVTQQPTAALVPENRVVDSVEEEEVSTTTQGAAPLEKKVQDDTNGTGKSVKAQEATEDDEALQESSNKKFATLQPPASAMVRETGADVDEKTSTTKINANKQEQVATATQRLTATGKRKNNKPIEEDDDLVEGAMVTHASSDHNAAAASSSNNVPAPRFMAHLWVAEPLPSRHKKKKPAPASSS